MIPQIIHQIVGKNPSELVSLCLSSWKILQESEFRIIYWTDEDLKVFIQENYAFALSAFETARNHAEAADIGRYLIIYHFGGIYVDWDISLNEPERFIELICQARKGYVIVDPLNGTLASEHFSAQPRNSYLYSLVRDIVDTFDRDERDLMNTPQYSGPFRMRATLRKCEDFSLRQLQVKDVFEYSYDEVRSADKFRAGGIMTHFWEHSWF